MTEWSIFFFMEELVVLERGLALRYGYIYFPARSSRRVAGLGAAPFSRWAVPSPKESIPVLVANKRCSKEKEESCGKSGVLRLRIAPGNPI